MIKTLNMAGLALGMVGVAFIFFWGPPQPSFEQGVSLGLADGTPLSDGRTVAQHNIETAATKRRYKCLSLLGLIFIFLGFLLQFVALFLPDDK
ncbi:MAG: hypothetical protein ACLQFI_19810 [Methylocella sp.]|jgi:drug/metabolite transporter (DMT)-like permease